MSRSAIPAAACVLLCVLFCALVCVSFPRAIEAQRAVPRHSVLQKSAADTSAQSGHDLAGVQSPSIAPGTGSIIGAVVDSLHDAMLAGGTVTVQGLPARHAVSTASGAFRIDSIPPGRYVLELSHPILDSLGVRVASDTISVTEGRMQTAELAIPALKTVIAAVCSPAKLRFGPGVVLGRVLDADTDKPAVGAEVSVAWTEMELGDSVGLRAAPRLRKGIVTADGTYRICGVPANFSGTIQASHGSSETAEVPIHVAAEPLAIRMLFLPPAAVASTATGATGATGAAGGTTPSHAPDRSATGGRPTTPRAVGHAVVTGRVTNVGGVPVADASVTVQGSDASALTGPDGKFTLTGVVSGTQSVIVRRVGYSPVAMALDVTSRAPNQITVRLGAYTPVLSTVDVTAKAETKETTGFARRRKMGMGRYMDYDDIQKIQPIYTSDILRHIPGLYVSGSGSSASVQMTRGNGCVTFLVDGNPVSASSGQSIDDIMGKQDISAIEFYNPVDIPMELAGTNTGCGLVAIWTKGRLKPSQSK
jgi:carboxypeptidase family protein